MYPQTIFQIDDQSAITYSTTTTPIYLYELMVSSTSKGPEDMRYVSGDMFYKLYGSDISFTKHGQPLIQADNVIRNGGGLLFKRLVARDATLANLAISAKVKKVTEQKKNSSGELLYLDADGKETTTVTDTPSMTTHAQIKYNCEAVVGAQTISDVYSTMKAKLNVPTDLEQEAVIPLFIIADNGRGLSKKKVRISPNYTKSKNKSCMRYILDIIENGTILETLNFTLDHNYIDDLDNTNKSLETVVKSNSNQMLAKVFEDYFDAFIDRVATITELDSDYLYQNDMFFGFDKTNQLNYLSSDIVVDLTNGFNLSFVYGIDLTEGTNGSFGASPFGTSEYSEVAVEFFDGTFTSKIYDLYNAQFGVAIDANYPEPVKNALEALVMFREDFVYFRDSGIKLFTLDDILAYNDNIAQSKFIAPYALFYNVIDYISKKEVTVTVGYSLARLMINHFRYGRNRPVAGILHEMTIPEAIENTINFIPSVTPSIDEKKEMEDARVNYASYYEGKLTLETFWTSQKESTELSFVNNILAIQQVMQAIRVACPKNRYTLITNGDLTNYEKDVNAVISTYAGNFDAIKMEYAQDEAAIDEKIYYAIIRVVPKNFVNAEKFKLIALPVGTTL